MEAIRILTVYQQLNRKTMRRIFNKMALLIFLLSSCTQNPNNQNGTSGQETSLPPFKIENQELNTTLKKASFDIRLEERISEKEIELVAQNIKTKNPGFDRYFILYYLPDMQIGSGAWATSHFNPNLLINIQGISDEEEEQMTNSTLPAGELIGKWFDNRPYVENTMIIYKKDEVYKLRQIYKDGSFGDKELTKNGNKFTYESDFGEYIKIESNGTLGLYSENGKFATVNKAE